MTISKPNYLIIIADDLGFSDIGCYGAEIETPALDSLAEEGVRLLNYHTAAACSPTRAMVMSGTDAHLGGLGCLLEFKSNARGSQRWSGKAGHEGFLNFEVPCLPEILQDNGYFTFLAGKWHLGLRVENGPQSRGFQESFAMLPGCCNHYGWEPVLENGAPGNRAGGRPIHAKDGKRVHVPANTTDAPDQFYSSNTYTDKFLSYLDDRSAEDKAKPFFGYLAYSAPHWPLQAPKATREKYRGRYDGGPYALRKKRLAKLVELGILPPDVTPHDVVTPTNVSEWDDFNDYERQCSVRAMEAYAGMVDQMDQNIARVIQHLKDTGEYDNTMIIFMSDNGAEGAALEAIPVLGDNIRKAIHDHYDNSLENIGEWNSYTWLGPLWAQASTAPSRLYKCFPSEGGILVPAIVKPAKGTLTQNWTPGGLNRSFMTCMDLAPTFLDLAGLSLKPEGDGKVLHRGKAVHAMTGCSWAAYFGRGEHADPAAGDEWAVYPSTRPIGWELHAQAALRKGEWKIVHLPKTHGGKSSGWDDEYGWELFNVTNDPGENVDLADKEPEKFKELLAHWDEYVTENGLVWGPGAMLPGLSKEEAPLLNDKDVEMQRAWIQTPEGGQPVFT